MYGAILGDIIGSPFEFDQGNKSKEFSLFSKNSTFTDDSVMTIAVGYAFLDAQPNADIEWIRRRLISSMKQYGRMFPYAGYGGMFRRWLKCDDPQPYGSFGNGSAMRVSACGWVAKSIDEALDLAKRSAEITHNHPEGIKGAQAVAAAIFMARNAESKEDIRTYLEKTFGYDLHHICDEIRSSYDWDATCQGTVPPAFMAFFDANNFEEAIRLAVSLGGDSDTIACITGSIAQPYYTDISDEIIRQMQVILPQDFWTIINKIYYCIHRGYEYIYPHQV